MAFMTVRHSRLFDITKLKLVADFLHYVNTRFPGSRISRLENRGIVLKKARFEISDLRIKGIVLSL